MEGNNLSQMLKIARRIVALKYENVKLQSAIKLSLLLENIMVMIVGSLLAVCILLFMALAAVHFLSEVMQPGWAYLTIAGVYVVILALAVIFKRRLIGDSISRFISRHIFDIKD